MGRIKSTYHKLTEDRAEFLANAQYNERYTVMVGNNEDGTNFAKVRQGMYDTIGITITRALASTIISILYPPQVHWFKFDLEREGDEKLTTQQQSLLAAGEQNAMSLFDAMKTKSIMYLAHLHAIVAGNCVVHFLEEDKATGTGPNRCRMFPLSQFVCERDQSWTKRIIVQEPLIARTDEEQENGRHLYTEIDMVERTVKQEEDGGEGDGDELFDGEEVNDNPDRWVIVTNELPKTGRSYSPSYVDYYISKILHSNLMGRAFQDLVYEAARVIKGVRAGSGLNPHELEKLESGAWIEMDEGDIIYPEQTPQLSPGLQWVGQERERNNQELKTEFMFGLMDREGMENATATLIRKITSEMNSLGAQFFAHHQDHTQLGIAVALRDITGFTMPEGEQQVVPKVLTGQSALSRQEDADNLMQIVERLGTIDPEWVRQLPTNKIFQRLSDSFNLHTADLTGDQQSAFDLVRQLVAAIQENPQQVLPMVIQVVQQFMPDKQSQQQLTQAVAGQVLPQGAAPAAPAA